MKKAVILAGSKQYLVSEGDTIEVELVNSKDKTIAFEPLLIIDGAKTTIGKPFIDKAQVLTEVISVDTMGDKVTSIRYKAKKRVHKVHGHRQHHTTLKVTQIK